MPAAEFTPDAVYEVTFYASHHTKRTATRKLRFEATLVSGLTGLRTHLFLPLRRGAYKVVLADPDILEAKPA